MKTLFRTAVVVWFLLGVVSITALAAPKSKTPKRKTLPDPKLAKELVIAAEAEVKTYQPQVCGGHSSPEFAVYVPKAYSPENPMPLVVSSHGAGGSGKGEIGAWVKLAEQYGFLVVCPSYGIAEKGFGWPTGRSLVDKEDQMLMSILDRVGRSLNVDRELVLHTGFSGGGWPTCLVAMKHPDIFSALCYRSGNFDSRLVSGCVPRDMIAVWIRRPLYIFWGTKDHPIILGAGGKPGEGPASLAFYQQLNCTNLKHEILEGGGHDSHPEMAAKWFAEDVVKPILDAREKKANKRR